MPIDADAWRNHHIFIPLVGRTSRQHRECGRGLLDAQSGWRASRLKRAHKAAPASAPCFDCLSSCGLNLTVDRGVHVTRNEQPWERRLRTGWMRFADPVSSDLFRSFAILSSLLHFGAARSPCPNRSAYTVPVRQAIADDQPQLSKIAAEAFFDDELLGDVIHPYRKQYPEDTHLYWLARIRQAWSDASNPFIVSTVRAENEGDEQIAAWGQFLRKSKAAKKDTGQPDVSDLSPNRAAGEDTEDILERQYGYIAHEWSGPRAECWDIIWLATSPAYQGHGHARAVVQWVIDRATQEQVPSSVISAKGKDGFYNKLGYTTPSGKASEPDGNPLYGLVEGGQFWWKEDHLASARAAARER